VNEVRIGLAIRALRRRRRLRQVDVAVIAGVSQTAVSRCERGVLRVLRWDAITRIADAVGMRIDLRPLWRGGELDRLLDADHAALQAWLARSLELRGWTVVPEATFSRYGERGSIDVLAHHPPTGSVLVTEIKTVIADMQGLLRSLDAKVRLAPAVARGLGWESRRVVACLLIAEERTNRRRVADHGVLLGRFATRGVAAKRWLGRPIDPVHGLLIFQSLPSSPGVTGRQSARHRIRVRRPSPSVGRRPAGPETLAIQD
jgi:transcriptional regulator with XRE-family HTH domain